ncbi:MAG: ATP-binding protein [Candidatus Omnitrophota bacterium]
MSYERTNIINLLEHRINSFSEGYRQNIAIIGEHSIGKTTLIKTLLSSENIKKDSIIPIYLEIKIEPFEFCIKRFIKSALFQLLESDPTLKKPHSTLLIIEDLKRTHPKTANICARVLQDIEKNRFDEAYSFMMDITANIYEETKKRPLVILDEFHNLENFMLRHPFSMLARKIMIQKDTMYLLLSSKNAVGQRIIDEKLSMLFGNFEKILLPPFDIFMSRSFIQDNLAEVIKLPQVYIDYISSFSGNKPLYMKILCDEIKRIVLSKEVDPSDIKEVIKISFLNCIFKKTGIINQMFSNFFVRISDGKLQSRSAAVLIALSSENKKQDDITKTCRMQKKDVSKILNRFMEMDILSRNGSMYRFKDRLFFFWIRSVYLKRIMSFSIDEMLEEEYFKKEMSSHLDEFMEEFEKEFSSRIMGLFKLFKNDVIQLNGRKHKFLLFDEVGMLKENFSNSTNILAANSKTQWLCTIKKDYVTENDLLDIMDNIKKKRQETKLNRLILISLSGIHENAYLLAKEAKFWIWNLESLNILMELYSKPHIG